MVKVDHNDAGDCLLKLWRQPQKDLKPGPGGRLGKLEGFLHKPRYQGETMNLSRKILFVDDEPNVLSVFERQLRKSYEVETAPGGADGLTKLSSRGPFAVVVSDMRMPGMDGVKFLSTVREQFPDTVRILLTGYSEIQQAIDAINQGSIFRFLTKPCPQEVLIVALNAALDQYRLVHAERELLEKTLRGSVQVLGEILALVNPTAFGRAARVQRLVGELVKLIEGSGGWEIDVAVVLSQLGCVAVPEQVLAAVNRGADLSQEERRLMEGVPAVTRDLLRHIPRLDRVIEIINYKDHSFDKDGKNTPLASRILTAAYDFDAATAGGLSGEQAVARMNAASGRYDPAVMTALADHVRSEILLQAREVALCDLQCGWILAEDLHSDTGVLLLRRSNPITEPLKRRLEFSASKDQSNRKVKVFIPQK